MCVEQVVDVPLVTKLHEGFELHANESLLASEHYEKILQVPTVGVVELAGVKAQTPSVPFPAQASLVVYDEQVDFGIHFVPSETQSTLLIATEHDEDDVNAKSVQTFNLQMLETVVGEVDEVEFVEFVELVPDEDRGNPQKQSPSVPD